MTAKLFSLFSFAVVCACARPNYAPAPANAPERPPAGADAPGGEAGTKPSVCKVKFASRHCVTVTWELLPTEEETGAFTFVVTRPDPAGPVPEDLNGVLSVVAWMPGMGHGSSPITVTRTAPGTYRATEVFFTMRGEWELRFLLKSGEETRDQAVLSLVF